MPKPARTVDDGPVPLSRELHHKLECRSCPLNAETSLRHAKMEPTGSADPLVYVLAEAPGQEEDDRGVQMVGPAGALLRTTLLETVTGKRIEDPDLRSVSPKLQRDPLIAGMFRFNNTIRCLPKKGLRVRAPVFAEVESCRPSIIRDIEASRPRAIFGFGGTPLSWAQGTELPITAWRGRRFPFRAGNHVCWFFPMLHPSYVNRNGGRRAAEEALFQFELDIRQALELVPDLPPPLVPPDPAAPDDYLVCVDGSGNPLQQIQSVLAKLRGSPYVAIDIETDTEEPKNQKHRTLRPYGTGASIVTIALSSFSHTLAVALDHPEMQWSSPFVRKQAQDLILDFLLEYPGNRIAHNTAFELEWLAYQWDRRIIRAGVWEDTQAQGYLLYKNRANLAMDAVSLDWCMRITLGTGLKHLSPEVNTKAIKKSPLGPTLLYNALDAKWTHRLFFAQWERLRDEGFPDSVYELQRRRIPTIVEMQLKGAHVDPAANTQIGTDLLKEIAAVDKAIHKLAVVKRFEADQRAKNEKFKEYNPASPPQTLEILNKYLKQKVESTGKEVLGDIKNPFAKVLSEWRDLNKRYGTYVRGLTVRTSETDHRDVGKYLWPDGLLHFQFNSMKVVTGRLSSDGPNAQNFPKRKHAYIRAQIIPPPGYIFLAVDYGQIEARVIAMASRDATLCKALWEDFDIHQDWAVRLATEYPARVGGKEFLKDKDVMKRFRTDVKNQWTFPLFFGASLDSVSTYLQMPPAIVNRQVEKFWADFSGVKSWQDELSQQYDRDGYVATLTHRRREAPMSLNELINMPIQGTASDIVVEAMCALAELANETGNLDLIPVLNIHDDLTFAVPEDRAEAYLKPILTEMLRPRFGFINVPIAVEAAAGPNWWEMTEFGKYYSNKWEF